MTLTFCQKLVCQLFEQNGHSVPANDCFVKSSHTKKKNKNSKAFNEHVSVADQGFPIGGANLVGGAPTPETATFQKICMSKRKNLDP